MAAKAFILIETTAGKTKEVISEIQQLNMIESVDLVSGPYDLIVVVELDSMAIIGDLVIAELHKIDGISRTVTCLAI